MKTLPIEFLNELNAEVSFMAYIIDIAFSTPRCLTNADVRVYHESKVYDPRGMDLGAMEYSLSPSLDKFSIDLDNVDRLFSQTVQTEEIRGKRFVVRLAALDQNVQVIGTRILFDGLLDRCNFKRRTAKLNVYNMFVLWKKKLPRRTHTPTCPHTFKEQSSYDPRNMYKSCDYTGPATACDGSWDRCKELGNHLNFGGFRWLPSLADKQIWWGRKPS